MDRTARRAAPGRITFDGLTHRYPGGTVAVDGLSLEAPAGEVTVLIGPSGCGKSTILRTVNRLVTPTAGRVLIDGADVAAADAVALRRRVGYVIQHVGLFPHQSVRANVGTVPRLLGWPRRRVRERADELLALVGLDPATHGPRYPHQLSGGQRQRVGLARALAADPVVLLMDEPFSAVDPVVRARLREEFLRLRERVATTIILVIDVPYGDVMRLRYGGKDLAGNGGDNGGLFRVANYLPDSDGKFRIAGGDTYYQAVELGRPVRAKVLLAYGNATQPGSKYIGDQLELFAAKAMRDAWLTRADIEANLDLREELPPVTSAPPEAR